MTWFDFGAKPLVDDGQTVTIDSVNNRVGINNPSPAYPVDILQIKDIIGFYLNHQATTAAMYPLDILSSTCGPRFSQASSLGGTSAYFEPDYPTLLVQRTSSSRGAAIKLGNATGGFYIYASSAGYIIYNPDGVTQILNILAADNIVDIKKGIKYTPSSDTTIVAADGITVTNAIMRVVGNGGAIDITADPQIVAGTDGQIVILQGTHDTNTVKLDNGTGLALSASITLAKNDNITLMYDSGESVWIELSRTTVV